MRREAPNNLVGSAIKSMGYAKMRRNLTAYVSLCKSRRITKLADRTRENPHCLLGASRRDSLSFDHRVYLGAEGVQSERLGQHVHAWIEEVASEGSVLSVA